MAATARINVLFQAPHCDYPRAVYHPAEGVTYVYPDGGTEITLKGGDHAFSLHPNGGLVWRGLYLGHTPQKEYVSLFGRVTELTPQLGVHLIEAEFDLDEVSCDPPEEEAKPSLYSSLL